jgi:hypothetical protein
MCKLEDKFEGITFGQRVDVRARGAGLVEDTVEIRGLSAAPALSRVGNVKLAMKSPGISHAAGENAASIAVRCHDSQYPLLSAPAPFNTVAFQVAFKLAIHYIGRKHQCEFAKPG